MDSARGIATALPVGRLPGSQTCGRWRTAGAVAGVVAGGGLVGLLWVVDPAAAEWFPPCPFHALTGLHCPGCGTLRATHALLNGRPLAALLLNPLYMLLLGAILAGGFRRTVAALRRQPSVPLSAMVRPAWIVGLAVVICAYWVVRNLPWSPFTLLAP
jgi:hypothetical protein